MSDNKVQEVDAEQVDAPAGWGLMEPDLMTVVYRRSYLTRVVEHYDLRLPVEDIPDLDFGDPFGEFDQLACDSGRLVRRERVGIENDQLDGQIVFVGDWYEGLAEIDREEVPDVEDD